MFQSKTLRSGLAAIALAGLGLAACGPEKPLAVAPSKPPEISLAPKIIDQAGAYRNFIDRTSSISPAFVDGSSVSKAVEAGSTIESGQIMQGVMAYGAIVALEDPAFVAGVRAQAIGEAQRLQLAESLAANPYNVLGIRGSGEAASRVALVLAEDGQRLYDAGKAVKQSAYDVQKQAWSKVEVANRTERLANAKSLSAIFFDSSLSEAELRADAAARRPAGGPVEAPYSQTVVRSLAVAAMAVLGQAGSMRNENVSAVMQDPNIGSCARMTKLNTNQCLAVSKPYYEDIFCLGQHIMMDSGRCVIKASGQKEPYEPRFVPTVRPNKPTQAAAPARKPAAKKK
jgi:hypothetical protein